MLLKCDDCDGGYGSFIFVIAINYSSLIFLLLTMTRTFLFYATDLVSGDVFDGNDDATNFQLKVMMMIAATAAPVSLTCSYFC